MSRAVLVRLLAGWTDLSILNDTKSGVKHSICNRLIILIGLIGGDFNNRTLQKILRIGDAELDADNSITHVYYLLLLCVDYSVLILYTQFLKYRDL